jgi:alanine racemase
MLCWIELDASRLKANIAAFRRLTAPSTALMIVVKANAYGHGLREVAPLVSENADWFGVNNLEEARIITNLGLSKPIAILGHTPQQQAEDIVRHGYRQVVYRQDVASALSTAAQRLGTTAHIHLKVETGTNRQGISLDDLDRFAQQIKNFPALHIEGLYTHFANIEDTLDPSFAQLQLTRFRGAVAMLERNGIRPPQIHAAATSGTLLYPETAFTMIRVGIGTYGIWPSRETQLAARERGRLIGLAPVLMWKTRIAQTRNVHMGDYVGYGLTFQANREMRVGVLPVGYYDGYDRKLSNSARVLVRGQFAPVIGRVAMNMTMIDLTDIAAEPDDEVVLIGRQGKNELRAEDLAEKAGTIAYELLARINPLLPRIVR